MQARLQLCRRPKPYRSEKLFGKPATPAHGFSHLCGRRLKRCNGRASGGAQKLWLHGSLEPFYICILKLEVCMQWRCTLILGPMQTKDLCKLLGSPSSDVACSQLQHAEIPLYPPFGNRASVGRPCKPSDQANKRLSSHQIVPVRVHELLGEPAKHFLQVMMLRHHQPQVLALATSNLGREGSEVRVGLKVEESSIMNPLCLDWRHDERVCVQHVQHRHIAPATHTHSLVNMRCLISGSPCQGDTGQPEGKNLAWMGFGAQGRKCSSGFSVESGRGKSRLDNVQRILFRPGLELSICFFQISVHHVFVLTGVCRPENTRLDQVGQGAPIVAFANTQQASVHQVRETSF